MPRISFGRTVREKRVERQIGLREFAKQIGVSPTYLSKVERGEFAPPAEDKVVRIAQLLELDRDALLALAGKVASDVQGIIRRHPVETASFLRSTQGWTAERLAAFVKDAARKHKA